MNSPKRHKFHRWKPAACLLVSGEDAARFLQGQFTNDLQKGGAGEAVYGLWLNQKGKVLADSFIKQKSDHEFWVVSYFSPAAVIRERLEAYIIADDVTVEDRTAEWEGLTVFGERGDFAPPEEGFDFAGRRSSEVHREFVFPSSQAGALTASTAGDSGCSPAEIAARRIGAGIPAIPADIGPADLPNEGGLEQTAISYTKGCYLGQEVMARLKSMGQVRRKLVQVRGSGAVPAVPTALFQAGRKIGELRSAASDGESWIGLALVTLLQLERTAALSTAAETPGTIRLAETP